MIRYVLLLVASVAAFSVARSAAPPPQPGTAPRFQLRASVWRELDDADREIQRRQTERLPEAEIKAVHQRLAQLRELDASSPAGESRLIEVLQDPQELPYVRKAAFASLAQAEMLRLMQIDPDTAEGSAALVELLKDSDAPASIRRAVVTRLFHVTSHSPELQQAVLRLVRTDADVSVCHAAIHALYAVGTPAADAVEALIPMLEDHRNGSWRGCSSGEISHAAICALIEYGPAAVAAIPRLAWEIDPANNRSRHADVARIALGRIAPRQYPYYAHGEDAIQPLIEELSSAIPGRRLRAAERLLELCEFAARAVPALQASLHDANPQTRATAAAVILTLQPHQKAADVLARFAKSDDPKDRTRYISWLNYRLNCEDEQILLNYLSDTDCVVRSSAAVRLAKTNRHIQQAFRAMIELYREEQSEGQLKALQALGSFDPELLRTESDLIERAAAETGAIGYHAKHLQRKLKE